MKYLSTVLLLLSFSLLMSINVKECIQHPAIDSALKLINMDYEDITFNFNQNIPDYYRLKSVDKLFNTPMQTYTIIDSLSNNLWETEKLSKSNSDYSIAKLIRQAWTNLEVAPNNVFLKEPSNELSKKQNKQIDKLNITNKLIVKTAITQIPLIIELTNEAFSSFSEVERKDLFDFFNKEENSENNVSYLDLKAWREQNIKSNQSLKDHYKLLEKTDFNKLAQASVIAAELVDAINKYISESKNNNYKNEEYELELSYGKIIINPKQDCKLDDAILVIDYKNNNAYSQSKIKPFLLLMDYFGNDQYNGSDYAQGGAFMGIQYFLDYDGDDRYNAKSISQGASCLGTGLLLDFKGDDYYSGDTIVQGAGKLGVGLLIDLSGNDQYFCSLYGQGFGYTKGFGALCDILGHDTYIVKKTQVDWLRYDSHYESLSQGCGLGIRPYFSGGIGILTDKSGNDMYVSDIYGQGTAYWFSLGGLVDGSGNDSYISYQYAQGAGIHLAFGAIIDYTGDDFYKSNGVSQGCGHDLGLGGLLDLSGNDNYVCTDLSQGGGNANAISVFIDYAGDDGYIAKKDNVMGYSDLRRNYGYIGLFLDLNGNDQYGSPIGGNNKNWVHSYYGIGLDTQSLSKEKIKEMQTDPAKPADLKLPENDDLEMLFLFASAQPQSLAHLVQPARDRIIKLGDKAMPYLIEQMTTEQVREQLALTETIPKIGSKALPYLKESLNDTLRASFAISLIGMCKDSLAFEIIRPFLQSNHKYLLQAIKASGEMSALQASELIVPFLKDKSTVIRRESAIALQKIPNKKALNNLIDCLNDPYQEVRYSAEIAISKIVPLPEKELSRALESSNSFQKEHLKRLLKK